ncbi:MAG TPA: FdhF/YdeP family oxidoreductase [Pyrinomonadaceae bacterium]|jgi:molybdopterin-dependent oxidoreductase alpha subunit
MSESGQQNLEGTGGQAQRASENAAEAVHPSHYEAVKTELKTEAPHDDDSLAGPDDEASQRAASFAEDGAFYSLASTGAQPPDELTGIEIKATSRAAGGIPAILATAKFTLREMGLLRGTRTLLQVNQKDGVDCPGCAWPDPDGERSIVEFCENGAKHIADEATTKRLTPEFFKEWTVADLSSKSDYWLNQQGRLTHPLVLREGSDYYEPLSWPEAFELIASELNALASPDQAIFYTSGRASNEAAFLYQLFVRQFGTNNLPDCSNMCHESSGSALTESIGVGKGTVTLEDFNLAEAIFVIGQNPGTNHPRMLTSLQAAKRRGCKLVHINPLPETGMRRFKHPQEVLHLAGRGTELSDLFLQVRINGDVALLKGIMKEVLEAEDERPGRVLDHKFIEERTHGFTEFVEALRAVGWDEIVLESGVERSLIHQAAEIFISSERTIFCWAMGLTQHRNAVANIQEIANLMFLRGQIGKPGAGLCPVRGHSNVQGDRTVGIWERPRAAFLDNLAEVFNFEPPRHHGLDTVESIKAMHAGRARVFFALGGNFLSATPDTEYTAEALRRCRLTAHVSTKLNRAHLITGEQALILPCLGRTEIDMQASGPQFVSTENSMGVVQASVGRLEPASEHLLSEPAIVAALARATLDQKSRLDWDWLIADYDRIRDLIEKVIKGFEDYNRRVREPGGFYLPNAAREGEFNTATGKANFTVHRIPHLNLASDQYLMMTIRSHDQFNTTIYGLDDRYRGIYNERRVVLLNPEDIKEAGLEPEQAVDLFSHFEGQRRTARRFLVVPFSIPRRCAATYFPEANVLVPVGSVAEKSNTPASKSVIISIKPSTDVAAQFDDDRASV